MCVAMALRPETHRPATLKRRDALLEAAIAVVAERGPAGVTHREVARRAGLPLATTSYFFASIDELVLEALRATLAQLGERLEALTMAISDGDLDVDAVIGRVVPVLLRAPETHVLAQFQAYLRASRDPEWQPEAVAIFAAVERVAAAVLEAGGVPASRANVRGVIALVDGFQLQRLAGVSGRTASRDLAAALRALLSAQAQPSR